MTKNCQLFVKNVKRLQCRGGVDSHYILSNYARVNVLFTITTSE